MAFDTFEQTADEMSDHMRELVSLTRLVTYARNNAKDLNAEFSTYCLDLALGSLVEELTKYGMSDMAAGDQEDYPLSSVSGLSH